MDALMAFRFFTLPALFGLVNRIFILIAIVFLHEPLSVMSALLGTLVTNLLLIGCCLLLMRRALGWDFGFVRPRLDRRQWAYMGCCLAGQVGSTLAAFAPYYLLGGCIGGTLAAMNYAQRIASMPYVLLATQFLAVVGVKLNEQHARRDWDGLNRTLIRTSNALSFLLIPIACFVCVYAREIVQVLLQRGSFGEQSTDSTAQLLRYLILFLPVMALTSVSARLFMAAQRMDIGLYCQIIGNVLLIAAMVAGVHLMGAVGYPIAQLLVGGINLILLVLVNRRLFPYYRYAATLTYLSRVACVCLAIAAGLWIVRRHTLALGPVWCLSIGGLGFGSAWWCINRVHSLNVEITDAITEKLRELLG
jgi:peptidoglycan biosynthesis protein MviN/MurJ (putative lipid II flippase)